MPRRYNFKLFANLILFILVIQLNYLVNIYEMARIDFNVPTIDHLQKTPIEKEIKGIYKEIPQGREGDKMEHRWTGYCVTATLVYGGMYQ